MFAEAVDFPGSKTISMPFFLTRIIGETPVAFSPANGDTTTDKFPTFRWQLPQFTFAFTQRIEVFRLDAGFPTFVTSIGKISSEARSQRSFVRLSPGTYFWTISVVDDFGNISRSKEATFTIQ